MGSYFLNYVDKKDSKIVRLTLFAFAFSWLGDVLLMFGDKEFMFFLMGLVAFLIAQIFYISLFLRTINISGNSPFLKRKPFWILFYIVYGFIVYILLFNHLNEILRIAVFIYMTVLLGMSVMALNRFGIGYPNSFTLVFAGSLFFVFSDTMIAINKFLVPVPFEGIIVMSTYITAQYLIMRGILKQFEQKIPTG